MRAVIENENIIFSCDECVTNSIKTVNNKVDGLYTILNRMEKNMKMMYAELEEIKNQMVAKDSPFTGSINNNKGKNTYAKVAQSEKTKVVLVRPKNIDANGDSKKTKEKIKNSFDPKKVKILSVVNISKGGVAIECRDESTIETIKEIATEKMGNDYTIEDAKERKPRVKIVGMNEKHTNEEIIEMLQSQNESLANDKELRVIRLYEVKNKYFSAIVEMSKEHHAQCIGFGSVNIGWDKCKIYEEIPLTMCMKCCRYNHIAQNCKFERIVCRQCGGNHKVIECKEKEQKCINCETANKKHGFKFDINHRVDASSCEVRKQKIELIRHRMK